MKAPLDIAVIGLAGVYPGARDAQTFWRNICAKVDAITDADPEWTGPYFEENTKADDRIYTTKGGFLKELASVDALEVGLMPNVAAGSDPDHLMALKVARDALDDAGYLKKKFDGTRAGVVIARGTYGNRGLASMLARGFFMDQMMDVVRSLRPDLGDAQIRELQTDLKKQLPPYGGDWVGVLTPNVIASLIANRLDLMGPAYIVDAACASSLIAVDSAVQELAHGRADLMLVGGTHVQTPPQLFIQFCQIGALSRDRLRPFQKGAEGTLLGEGCGMLVLKRLADAERDADRIYAVIKGVGVASDGKAKGLLAPRLEGEVLAMKRAYESSGIDPMTVDLVEAHGTGTSVGDKTEVESLTQVYGGRGAGPQIAISGVKSMIGHCLPGTGAASMIKTVLALHHKVLPPMLCDEPDPALGLDKTPFYINNETRPWVHGRATPRRAGVNAFGFGGINAHVILEEYRPKANATKTQVAAPLLNVPNASELFLLAADSNTRLAELAQSAVAHLRSPNPPSLPELCAAAAAHTNGRHRLAIVCETEAELATKLEQAAEKIARADARPYKTRSGVFYGAGPAPGKLCILFPGEGSQYPGMLADLCMRFPQVRDWFDFIEENARARGSRSRAEILFPAPTVLGDAQRKSLEDALFEMDVGAESVFSASLGLQALFDDLELKPDAMLGHSTGENTALTACRLRRFQKREEVAQAVQEINAIYRRLEAEGKIVEGTLLTVGGLTAETRAKLLADLGGMQLAMDNCPNQIVLFGKEAEAEALREALAADGAICQKLPFGRAYHTPLFKPLADAFRGYFKTLDFGRGRTTLYSARSRAPFPDDADGIRELTAQQWENPVRFTETLERLYADGFRVFLEVGPSANLTSFVSDTLRAHADVVALSSNSRRKSGVTQMHQTLAQLFASGIGFSAAKLYAHRALAPFDLLSAPRPAKKAKPKLPLQMPVVKLPDEWKERLRSVPPPVPGASVAGGAASSAAGVSGVSTSGVPGAAPLHPSAGSIPAFPGSASAAAGSTPLAGPGVIPAASAHAPGFGASAASTADPRLAALQSHFALMQEFLDSQARVMGLATGNGGAMAPARPAVAAPSPEAERFPLLGRVVESSTDRLVTERVYDLDTDLFIRDHCIGGTPSLRDGSLLAIPVIPFTVSMEIAAEAAARLVNRGDRVVVGMENSRGSRWLSMDEGQVHLRIAAERAGATGNAERVFVRMFLLGQGGPASGLPVFEATVLLDDHYPPAPAPMAWASTDARAPTFNPDEKLYARGMFHGPRMQGAKRVVKVGEASIDLELATIPTHDYFSFTQAPRFQFDTTLADVLGQKLYYWLQEKHGGLVNCFPYQVGKMTVYGPMLPAGTRVPSRATVRVPGPDRLSGDLEAIGPDGKVHMRMEGFDDRTFIVPDRFYQYRLDPPRRFLGEIWMDGLLPAGLHARCVKPFEDDLLAGGGGIWGRGLAHMTLDRQERAQFYAIPQAGPRRFEWLLGRIAAKEAARDWFRTRLNMELASADVHIRTGANGRPVIQVDGIAPAALPSVSIAHSRGYAVAVATDPGLDVGVDYRRIEGATPDDAGADAHWLEKLPAGERGLVAAALGCAREAAAKASGLGLAGSAQDWEIVASQVDPRAGFGSARTRRQGREFDVALRFEGGDAISALCVVPAAVDGSRAAVA